MSFCSDEGDEFFDTILKYVPIEDDAGLLPRRADMLLCLRTESQFLPQKTDNFLALVMFFIHKGFYVPKEYLDICIAYINDLLSGKRVEDGWDDYPRRLNMLKNELKELIDGYNDEDLFGDGN